MEHTVWTSQLDERYDCRVTRTEPYRGRLVVEDTSNQSVILDQEVGLSYDAQFGPDMDDVGHWQHLCVEAVDGLTK